MACLTVQITGGIEWQGPVFLDTDKDSNPKIDDSDVNLWRGQYVDETVYNVSFPNTSKNYNILNGLLSGSALDMTPKELDVTMIYNSDVMKQNKMKATKNSFHSDGRFYVVLYNEDSFARKAKGLLLKDIDFKGKGQVNHIRPIIDIINNEGRSYVDDGYVMRFPLDTNTDTITPSKYYLESDEQRPYVYALPILKYGFKQIGIVFKCPFLESEYGRNILCYLNDDNYNNLFPKEDFTGEVKGFTYASNTIYPASFNDIITGIYYADSQGRRYFNLNTGTTIKTGYQSHALVDFTFSINLQPYLFVTNKGSTLDDELTVYVMMGEEIAYEETYAFQWAVKNPTNINVNIFLEGIVPSQRKNITVRYKTKVTSTINEKKFFFIVVSDVDNINTCSIKVNKKFIDSGNVYNVNQLLQGNDTLYDFLIGMAQVIFGKIDIHYSGRVINLLTPFDVKLNGETIEGYYKTTVNKLNRIRDRSHDVADQETTSGRYIGVGFKVSNDLTLTQETVEDDKVKVTKANLYSTFVDFGEKYSPSKEDFNNIYFEPTKNIDLPFGRTYGITILSFTSYKTATLVPAVIGTENYKNISVGRRILYSYGKYDFNRVEQLAATVVDLYDVPINKNLTLTKAFMAYQDYSVGIHKMPVDVDADLIFNLSYRESQIIDYRLPNLYTNIAKKFLISLRTKHVAIVECHLNTLDYLNFDKRSQYIYNVRDHVIIGYINSVNGFSPCDPTVATSVEIVIFDPFINKPEQRSEIEENNFVDKVAFDFYVNKAGCVYTPVQTGTSSI